MPLFHFLWTPEIIDHLDQHGVEPAEFERIVQTSADRGVSNSTGRPTAVGLADDGRILYCVYEMLDELTVLPVTAFEESEDV